MFRGVSKRLARLQMQSEWIAAKKWTRPNHRQGPFSRACISLG